MPSTQPPPIVNTLTIPQFLEGMAKFQPWERKLFFISWQQCFCTRCGGTLTEGLRGLCMHCIILGV